MAAQTEEIAGLVESVIRPLIDNPDDLVIDARETEDGSIFVEVRVNEEDAGKVIGRQGRGFFHEHPCRRGAARLMSAWVRVAEFTKAKHLKGGLVARSVAGLPFLLEEGLFCAFVPPVIDVPRQGTVVEVRPEARGGATVFFDTVVDANQADALVGCYVLARREDLPDDVLELQEGGIEGFTVVDAEAGAIGTAVAINEMPGQHLLEVAREGQEGTVLIPVVDEFLEGVDEQTRCIYVNVPQGLLDL